MAKSWRHREKKPKRVPLYEHTPWTGAMVMQPVGQGDSVHYGFSNKFRWERVDFLTERLRWVDREDPAKARIPQPVTKIFRPELEYTATGKERYVLRFEAAGQVYTRLKQLFAKADEGYVWCEDIHGREVFYIAERMYTAMDVYDTMHDTRSHRWFFIRQYDQARGAYTLTRIYTNDEDKRIYVTEDVRDVETICWREMKKYQYFG